MIDKKELEQKLADVRARQAAVEAKRAQTELEQLAEQLAKEERALEAAEALSKAEAEHGVGKVGLVETDLGPVVVKRPNHVLFRKFQDTESIKSIDVEKFVRPCVVHPTREQFDKIVEELPATLMRVANVVTRLAGARTEEISGKS